MGTKGMENVIFNKINNVVDDSDIVIEEFLVEEMPVEYPVISEKSEKDFSEKDFKFDEKFDLEKGMPIAQKKRRIFFKTIALWTIVLMVLALFKFAPIDFSQLRMPCHN